MAARLLETLRTRSLGTRLLRLSQAEGRYVGIRNSSKKINEAFVVRRATCLDDLQWAMKLSVSEGWGYRKRDPECCFLAGLTPYFWIGELNGKRISCVAVVKYGENTAFRGCYLVDKPYRGHGYGLKTWRTALASIGDQCNSIGATVPKMAERLEKVGFRRGYTVKRYAFTAPRALEGLASSQLPPSIAQILPASQADFEKLFVYGADMLGTSQACKSLLAAWLSHAQESSWVAIGNKGEVVGYLIVSETAHFSVDGYCIAPFFADSTPIARSLLKEAVQFASANNPVQMFLDIAVDFNTEGVSILEKEVGAKSVDEYVLVYTKDLPDKALCKVFGFGSLEFVY